MYGKQEQINEKTNNWQYSSLRQYTFVSWMNAIIFISVIVVFYVFLFVKFGGRGIPFIPLPQLFASPCCGMI